MKDMMMRLHKSPSRERHKSGEEKILLSMGSESDSEEDADYEKAVEASGYGKFHYWLLFICGWANASDAIEVLCISFLLPSAECDLTLTSSRKGWLSAILFVGMMIGGYVWGSLGDSIGRRNILISAMLVNAAAGAVSSLSQSYAVFLVLRFISGLGVGGSIPVVWSYFAEFQPAARRGAMLSVLATFWMVGNITVAAIAWAVIPRDIGWSSDSFKFNSWRIFVVLCALPSFLVAVGLSFLPESPKFLLSKGKEAQALQVFKKMYTVNTGNAKKTYPISRISLEMVSPHIVTKSSSNSSLIQEAISSTLQLFNPTIRNLTITALVIHFSIQFGYYGLWLWFPELFNKLENYHKLYPNATVTVCQVIGEEHGLADDGTTIKTGLEDCDTRGPPDDQVFINSFIISLAAGPGNLWTILHMDKLGRKFFLVFSMILSGASASLIYLVNSSATNLLVSCLFGAISTLGFNSLDCLSIELFPTNLRGTAMAVTLLAARLGAILGNVVFGYFLEINCAIPIMAVAVLLIFGGLCGLLLPNTTRKPLL